MVLDGDEQVVPARDHGHARGEIAQHVVGRLAHPLRVAVEGEVLLDDGLARRQGNLDGSLDDGGDPLLDALLDGDLHKLNKIWVLLEQGEAGVDDDVRGDAVQVANADVAETVLGVEGPLLLELAAESWTIKVKD